MQEKIKELEEKLNAIKEALKEVRVECEILRMDSEDGDLNYDAWDEGRLTGMSWVAGLIETILIK